MKLFLDTETTGLPTGCKGYENYPNPLDYKSYDTSRMVQIGCIITDDDSNIISTYSSIVKPNGYEIPEFVVKIHGIDTNKAENEGKDINVIFEELFPLISECKEFIAHNVLFDYNILLSEVFRAEDNKMLEILMLMKKTCTKKLGREKFRLYKDPKLTELYKLCFPNKEWIQKHEALDDCMKCYECYRSISETDN